MMFVEFPIVVAVDGDDPLLLTSPVDGDGVRHEYVNTFLDPEERGKAGVYLATELMSVNRNCVVSFYPRRSHGYSGLINKFGVEYFIALDYEELKKLF